MLFVLLNLPAIVNDEPFAPMDAASFAVCLVTIGVPAEGECAAPDCPFVVACRVFPVACFVDCKGVFAAMVV